MSVKFPSSFRPIESDSEKIQPKFPSSFRPIADESEEGEIPQEKPEIFVKKPEIARHIGRGISRAVESAIGLPGDIMSIPERLITSGISRVTGISEEKLPKKLTNLPRSQELKELSTKIFGKSVQPETESEKLIDDIISDASTLAFPIKGKIPFLKSIGAAVAGNLAEKGAEKADIGESGQKAAKIGVFFLSGLMGKGNVKKFWNQKYTEAENAIPKNAKMDARALRKDLFGLERELSKGLETPSQKAVLKPLIELQNKIHDGKIRVADVVQSKKSLNELREQLFQDVPGRAARKGAKTKLNDISQFLDKSLETYGKRNKAFYDPYVAAQEAYGGFQQSKKVGKYISKLIPMGKLSKTALLVLESVFKPATLPYTAAAYGALKGGELLARMIKNPTLRKYYGDLIRNAAEENKVGIVRSLREMDKEIQKNPEEWKDLVASSE